ncbi:MAG: hypothetical protein V1707_02610 [bacterium]
MNINEILQSQAFKITLWAIGVLAVFLVVFGAGMTVGYQKARFSYRWGENYHRNFGGPKEGFFSEIGNKEFIESHGVFGQIIKIDGGILVVKGKDEVEKIVAVKDMTAIKRLRETVKIANLKVNDYLVVIGDPNEQGQIEAKFIRVMPLPEMPAKPSRGSRRF